MQNAHDNAFHKLAGWGVGLVRFLGWGTIAALTGFLISTVLIVGFGLPSARAATGSAGGIAMFSIYVALFLTAALWVVKTSGDRLEHDAELLNRVNAYIVRGFFFAVLFVGLADTFVAFMRVEGLLTSLFSEEMARNLHKSKYIATTIHAPLIALGFVIALFTRALGFVWLSLMVVAAELLIVLSRFVFSYEQPFMGDLVRYWYAALLMFSAAYTLLEDGHVRVDVIYAALGKGRKGKINAIGAVVFGMTSCWVIILVGMGSPQSIINAPVANFEVSQTGSSSMFIKYQMAAMLGIFAVTMLIQFVSMLFKATADYCNEMPAIPLHSHAQGV